MSKTLELNISNELGPEFRDQLIDNFTVIQEVLMGERGVSQEQLDGVIKGIRNVAYTVNAGSDKGDSPVEIKLMRTNIDGHAFDSSGERIDTIEREIKRLGGTLNV